MKKSKKQKKIERRKRKRAFVKWLIKNKLFWTWALVQRRRKKPTKFSYWRLFINCCFLDEYDILCSFLGEDNPHPPCPCILFTKHS